VKITVIATGFQPQMTYVPEVQRPVIPVVRIQAPPEPEPVQEVQYAAEEVEPVKQVDGEPMLDLDDLDTPAYLRQGRLLN